MQRDCLPCHLRKIEGILVIHLVVSKPQGYTYKSMSVIWESIILSDRITRTLTAKLLSRKHSFDRTFSDLKFHSYNSC